jgi:uncharacterized cupin superfamily protein
MRTFDLRDPDFEYDDSDPAGFRAAMVRPGPGLGAKRTGISMYEIPPGEAVCPYHGECGEEEWAMAVTGPMWVRDPDGVHRLEAFELVHFPVGPEGAHQIRNDGDETVRVLMFGENLVPGASVYPDSDKIGIWGGHEGANGLLYERATNVPYFHGESRETVS